MTDTSPWLIVARWIQITACIVLFGQLLFTLAIERDDGLARRGVQQLLFGCVVVIVLSGFAWLALVAASVSDQPVFGVEPGTLWLLFTATTFGHVWTLRALSLLLVALALWRQMSALAFVAAAACLASLALAGHAAAGVGTQREIELASDMVHLIAAGAWLGALPALAWILAHETETIRVHRVVRRFSVYGVASVTALVATGIVNAWYRLGSVAALTQSDYGRLLLAKLLLVAAMVVLALFNRYLWTPRLLGPQPSALRALRRNTLLEIVAGLGVIAIVGALGVTMPAAHSAMQHTMPAMHMGN
jgi:putative copper resistance protein D